jgi:O-acetyl-ADP-ribose deacetylase (regulator of RNase III)
MNTEQIRCGSERPRRMAEFAYEHNASIHMPRIGCGLAGGDWREIEPVIQDELAGRNHDVTVYDLAD